MKDIATKIKKPSYTPINVIGEKPFVVIFEGCDKSGKTTLVKAFNEATDYSYIVLDRFTISAKVYDEAYGRDRRGYYVQVEKSFNAKFKVLVVLCDASLEVINLRLNIAEETLPEELSDIEVIRSSFVQKTFDSLYDDILYMNTANKTVEASVLEILTYMENSRTRQGALYE